MGVKQLTRIALMASILEVVFISFSQILYLEAITLTIALFACVFDRKDAFWSSVIFGLLNLIIQGVSIWTFAYVLIFPLYSLLFSCTKKILLKYRWMIVVLVGLCSFGTGQLLDLPFILFSPKVTLIYVMLGLKTSIIQGCISALEALFLFDVLQKNLMVLERKMLK